MRSIARISTALLAAIEAEAHASPGLEICGLLLGTSDRITGREPGRNVAADPRSTFEVDPATLLATHRRARAGGPGIVGCYHSHPSGGTDPSARDATDAAPNGWLWLIVGAAEARLWRAVADGVRHGRFDPVTLTCVDAPPPPENLVVSRMCR
ncbi:MAG TPA: M67 family metallopeptidase [Sphingomonas sp.]|jgi:proteasome lid subunit RPN8/RPN11|uniref:M67 family metallopeptidase n=1 Tax=Sphingomonas sp. TaxID=28214 RepID=UPI002EDAA205